MAPTTPGRMTPYAHARMVHFITSSATSRIAMRPSPPRRPEQQGCSPRPALLLVRGKRGVFTTMMDTGSVPHAQS
jgi:hypothetical protein